MKQIIKERKEMCDLKIRLINCSLLKEWRMREEKMSLEIIIILRNA